MARQYTWLAGSNPQPVPSSRPILDTPEEWAEFLARPTKPAWVSSLHAHTDACLGEEFRISATNVWDEMLYRTCSVLGEGHRADDPKYAAFMGFVRRG